jgi:hypothetical protein
VLLWSLVAVRVLSGVGWDATVFVGFGEGATPTLAYAEERLGEVFLRPQQGHDGKFFFVQANDPWIIEPRENAEVLDLPLYRSQRMLYPMLAGGFGFLQPAWIVWSLLAWNVLAMGLGSWGTALVAQRMGGSPWFGLAFAINIGFVSVMMIDGAGILAGAAAFWALAAFLHDRRGWGVALLVMAALTREVMLLTAAGTAWWLWKRGRRRDAIMAALIPGSAVIVWALYLRLRIDIDEGSIRAFGLPLVGFAKAVPAWLGDQLGLLMGVSVLLLLFLYVRRVFITDALVGWGFLGFAPVTILFTEKVWENYFDITRAVAPMITAFALMVLLEPATEIRAHDGPPDDKVSSEIAGVSESNPADLKP